VFCNSWRRGIEPEGANSLPLYPVTTEALHTLAVLPAAPLAVVLSKKERPRDEELGTRPADGRSHTVHTPFNPQFTTRLRRGSERREIATRPLSLLPVVKR